MDNSSDRGSYTHTAHGQARKADGWLQWAREAITIIAAAGAAYMGIRVDLARNQLDIENLKTQQTRIESQIEKMRDVNMALREGARK